MDSRLPSCLFSLVEGAPSVTATYVRTPQATSVSGYNRYELTWVSVYFDELFALDAGDYLVLEPNGEHLGSAHEHAKRMFDHMSFAAFSARAEFRDPLYHWVDLGQPDGEGSAQGTLFAFHSKVDFVRALVPIYRFLVDRGQLDCPQ
ncbi:MAG: hypothetical protein ACFB21_16600 [Opitutales bacterium]